MEEASATAVGRLVGLLQPRSIILFGSRARGDAREGSDIDLLVVLQDERPPAGVEAAAYDALGDLKVPIDLVLVGQADIRAYDGLVGTVLHSALREGLDLYAQ